MALPERGIVVFEVRPAKALTGSGAEPRQRKLLEDPYWLVDREDPDRRAKSDSTRQGGCRLTSDVGGGAGIERVWRSSEAEQAET